MAEPQQNSSKLISAQLRSKANDFLSSRKHANNLADILQLFQDETDNYTPVLLTVELIFTELLKRGELYEEVVPLQPRDKGPESQYKQWLKECYETAWTGALECMRQGKSGSRLQALVTCCKLLQAEGNYPLEPTSGFHLPLARLKNIFTILLDSDASMSTSIIRFQEFCEYRDVQLFGLKVLSSPVFFRKEPSSKYMQNYLELFDKLLSLEITTDVKKAKSRDNTDEDKILCHVQGKQFGWNSSIARRYVNRAWNSACRWSLFRDPRTHKRALLLLIERLLPLLNKPLLTTDMLCDSLDTGGPISMLALEGVLELVRRHNIDYPDIYDKLYSMFEPEMFATRYKKRLMHVADIFLSSTHLPETLVAAFAKRLARLALLANPEDAVGLLQLIANLLVRHPGLKSMICYSDSRAIMSSDPFIMEETSAIASGAVGSSLWEVAALQHHWLPALCSVANKVLTPADNHTLFEFSSQLYDTEVKKYFKTIEMTFFRPQGMSLQNGERLLQHWDLIG